MIGDVEARLSALEWQVAELHAALVEVADVAGFTAGFIRGFVGRLVDANRGGR